MNYAQARKLEDGSGWRFTVRNDDDIWTHECCRDPGPPATEESMYGYLPGELTLGEPHAPHATKEEAEDCYNRWRRNPDHIRLDGGFGGWTGCEICDAPTKKAAVIRSKYVALCEEHLTIEIALSTIKDITSVIYS